MKKIISVILAVVMSLCLCVPAFAANPQSDYTLQFDENGKFKIMVIADPQDGHPTKVSMLNFISEALDAEQPDIVVFLGDNVCKDSENIESYEELLTPLVERGVPFTFVYGNHDDESAPNLSKEDILSIYQQFPGCLAYDADPDLHGCATHNLPILSSDGSKVAFNMWMFDSGDYVNDENGKHKVNGITYYDCVREDQIEWYKNVSAELESENGSLVPSLVFQHIITQEAMQNIFFDTPVKGNTSLTYNFSNGKYSSIFPNVANIDGIMMERPCPSFDNDGEWDALVERGDVMAVFTGHDHINNFTTTVAGIDAVAVSGATYNSYGKDYLRGVKIINIDENKPFEYEAHTLYVFDLALKDGSTIPGHDGMTKADYVFAKGMNRFLTALMKILNVVFIMGRLF